MTGRQPLLPRAKPASSAHLHFAFVRPAHSRCGMAPKMARPGHVEIAMTDASFLKRNGLSIAVILMMLTSWLG